MATTIITAAAGRPRRGHRCDARAPRFTPQGLQLRAVDAQGQFQSLLFRPVPHAADFEQSRISRRDCAPIGASLVEVQ